MAAAKRKRIKSLPNRTLSSQKARAVQGGTNPPDRRAAVKDGTSNTLFLGE